MFRFVAKHNEGWSEADELVAVGDYGNEITFSEAKTHDSGFGWEKYQPKPVPPRKLEPDDTKDR